MRDDSCALICSTYVSTQLRSTATSKHVRKLNSQKLLRDFGNTEPYSHQSCATRRISRVSIATRLIRWPLAGFAWAIRGAQCDINCPIVAAIFDIHTIVGRVSVSTLSPTHVRVEPTVQRESRLTIDASLEGVVVCCTNGDIGQSSVNFITIQLTRVCVVRETIQRGRTSAAAATRGPRVLTV